MRAVEWYVRMGFGGRIAGPWPTRKAERAKLEARVREGIAVHVIHDTGQRCVYRRKPAKQGEAG